MTAGNQPPERVREEWDRSDQYERRSSFCRNGRKSFLDIISTNKGLAKKYAGKKLSKVWSAPDHRYVLHNFRIKKTRRNAENFNYSTRDADMGKFVLTFDNNYEKLFIDNKGEECLDYSGNDVYLRT